MFKRLFQFSSLRNGNGDAAEPLALRTNGGRAAGDYISFAEIYQNSTARLPATAYNILKVVEMINSPHLSAMSPETKRGSLLMAFEAAGTEMEEILQDAILRQRALNGYEEEQRNRVRDLETAKESENKDIQADLDRITAEHKLRIQGNLDEVARQQDELHVWLKRKQQEEQRITDAVALCVPHGGAAPSTNLTAVLERAAMPRR